MTLTEITTQGSEHDKLQTNPRTQKSGDTIAYYQAMT